MPSHDQATREGINSRTITPQMVAVVLDLKKYGNATKVGDIHGLDRTSVGVHARRVEKKINCRLFARKRGRGNSEWVPIDSADWHRVQVTTE